MGKADFLNMLQHLTGVHQARADTARQVNLRHITGNHSGGAKTNTSQKHLHLLASGVLTLVENNIGTIESASAHVGQWSNFYYIALLQFGDGFKAQHLVQGVVQRAQIGVYFLSQISRQKAQSLACFNCGPYQ